MPADDQALIAAFLRGELPSVTALGDWVKAAAGPFRPRLRADWDDCVQDCLLEITRLLRAGSFRGDAKLKTYVWRVTSNACLKRIERAPRGIHQALEDLELPARTSSPLAETLSRDFVRIALRVLRETPEDCRKLWGMILEGLSYQEMSEHTGTAPGALRARVLRCRRKAWDVRARLLGKGSETPA